MTPRSIGELTLRTVCLHGVPFHAITEQETCGMVLQGLQEDRGGFVVTANLDHLLRAKQSESYRAIVEHADLVVADGMPLIWASRIQGTPLPERVAGSALCWSLSKALGREKKTLFLLGGNPGVAERAAVILEQECPGLRIVGTDCPAFGFEKDAAQLQQIRDRLVEAQPDMVYVALGSPKQEELIIQLRSSLPRTWWMGIGIGLSFITGDVRRAPVWMRHLGMEWLHRLSQEPQRLAKRYLWHGLPFGGKLLLVSMWNRVRRIGITSDPSRKH